MWQTKEYEKYVTEHLSGKYVSTTNPQPRFPSKRVPHLPVAKEALLQLTKHLRMQNLVWLGYNFGYNLFLLEYVINLT